MQTINFMRMAIGKEEKTFADKNVERRVRRNDKKQTM